MQPYKPDYHLDRTTRLVVLKNSITDEIILKYVTAFIPVVHQNISIQVDKSDKRHKYCVESIEDVITTGEGWMNIETHVTVYNLTNHFIVPQM